MIETKPFDTANFLRSRTDIEAYLNEYFLDGSDAELLVAIGNVLRSEGMKQISNKTGRSRESLYRSFAANGNPTFFTVREALRVIGFAIAPVKIRPTQATPKLPSSSKTSTPIKDMKRSKSRQTSQTPKKGSAKVLKRA